MARTGKTVKKKARAHLATAVFCERALEEKDSVITVVRIVDRLNVPSPLPDEVPGVVAGAPIMAFIGFKAGEARGKSEVRIRLCSPSGKKRVIAEIPVVFEGGEQGVNIKVHVVVDVREAGLFWYDILLDRRLVTRMPLRIAHVPRTPAEDASPDLKGES